MANLGAGIGSFMEGLTRGMTLKRQQDRDDMESKLLERRMNLLETKDARDAANDAQDRRWRQEDRAAEAPIETAKRKSILTGLMDQEAERTARTQAGAEAGKEFKSGKYGSFLDAYRNVALPKLQQYYLSKGDTAGADAIQRWGEHKGVEKGIHDYGEMMRALNLGDYDSAGKSLNAILGNGDYTPRELFDVSISPVLKDGKSAGYTVNYRDKRSGQSFSKDFGDENELYQFAVPMVAPNSMFDLGRRSLEEQRAAEAEKRKSQTKLASDIALEREKNKGQMDLENLKGANDIQKELMKSSASDGEFRQKLDLWKNMNENGLLRKNMDGALVQMTPQEAAQAVNDQHAALRGVTPAPMAAMGGAYQGALRPPLSVQPTPRQPVAPDGDASPSAALATVPVQRRVAPYAADQRSTGPGSLSDYERRLGLDRTFAEPPPPPAPAAPPPYRPAPPGGEGISDYEARLGLSEPRAAPAVAPETPKTRQESLAEYERRLGLDEPRRKTAKSRRSKSIFRDD